MQVAIYNMLLTKIMNSLDHREIFQNAGNNWVCILKKMFCKNYDYAAVKI